MQWHYIDENENKIGPLEEEQIKSLIVNETLTADTHIWCEGMDDWELARQTELQSLFSEVAPPPIKPKAAQPLSTAIPISNNASNFDRDTTKIYPPNPPRSPHMALMNLFAPGVAQVIFGKTGLGFTMLLINWINNYVILYIKMPLAIFIWSVLLIISIKDAYKTGKRLREGQPVGKWKLFPSQR